MQRCLAVADGARAAGRMSLAAEALEGAARLEPTAARRIAWARALVDAGSPARAREVARTLADDPEPAVREVARGLLASVPSPLPAPDPALADRVLAALVAGRTDEVLRELMPRAASLSPDMLRRLAEALQASGDVGEARRVWSRVRSTYAEHRGGLSLVSGAPFHVRSVQAGPAGLTLVTTGEQISKVGDTVVHVLLPDGRAWSRWDVGSEAIGSAWFGPRREVLTWGFYWVELRDADTGAVILRRKTDDMIATVVVAADVPMAAVVQLEKVELLDVSLAVRASFKADGSSLGSAAIAPSGDEVVLVKHIDGAVRIDSRGRMRRLPDVGWQSVIVRPDGRILGYSHEDDALRLLDHGKWSVIGRADAGGGPIFGFAFAPDGSRAALASNGELAVLEVATGVVHRHARRWDGQPRLDFSEDGQVLVAADETMLERHDVAGLISGAAPLSRWHFAERGFGSDGDDRRSARIMALDGSGRRLYARTGALSIWDLEARPGERAEIHWPGLFSRRRPGRTAQAFNQDGSVMAMAGNKARHVTLVRGGRDVHRFPIAAGVDALAVSASGDRVAMATGGELSIHSVGGPPRALTGGPKTVWRLAFMQEDRWLMVEGEGKLWVWELATGTRHGPYGPTDSLGAIDRDGARVVHWSGAVVHVAPLQGPGARTFSPCDACEWLAAAFMPDGATVELLGRTKDGERSFALNLDTGAVQELAAGASRLVPPGMVGAGGYLSGRGQRGWSVWARGQSTPVFTIAVHGDRSGWAAMTPGGLLDGHFQRPSRFALSTGKDRILLDLDPTMAEARVPGMVPGLLSDGRPPACSVVIR